MESTGDWREVSFRDTAAELTSVDARERGTAIYNLRCVFSGGD